MEAESGSKALVVAACISVATGLQSGPQVAGRQHLWDAGAKTPARTPCRGDEAALGAAAEREAQLAARLEGLQTQMEAAAAAGDGAAAPAVLAGAGKAAAFCLPDAEPPLLCGLAWQAVTDCMQMCHILHCICVIWTCACLQSHQQLCSRTFAAAWLAGSDALGLSWRLDLSELHSSQTTSSCHVRHTDPVVPTKTTHAPCTRCSRAGAGAAAG